MRRIAPAPTVAALVICTISCSAEQLGLPRTPVSAISPDGRQVAFVRNHPNPDPPSQTIWLKNGGAARQIQELGADSDWCNTIVWSADNSVVAYLVQDARLIAVDSASQRIVSETWLAPQDSYPPSRMVIDLSLNSSGTEARFRACQRNMVRPGYVHEPGACSEPQSMRIKPESASFKR
jgi:hypothetical protein